MVYQSKEIIFPLNGTSSPTGSLMWFYMTNDTKTYIHEVEGKAIGWVSTTETRKNLQDPAFVCWDNGQRLRHNT